MCLGIPGQIIEFVDEAKNIAKVQVSGVKRNVNISLVKDEGLECGDWVLIHVGFAMSKLDEKEAQETLELLKEMGSIYQDEMDMIRKSDIE